MGRVEGRDYKGNKEVDGGNGYAHYPHCGEGFPDVYRSKLTKLYTLNMHIMLCISYTSIKLLTFSSCISEMI